MIWDQNPDPKKIGGYLERAKLPGGKFVNYIIGASDSNSRHTAPHINVFDIIVHQLVGITFTTV